MQCTGGGQRGTVGVGVGVNPWKACLLFFLPINQSINQRSPQSHTRAEEKPHPSTTTEGANPASQSDAGLGGYARVATALVCETRSFSTPFIFQWRA